MSEAFVSFCWSRHLVSLFPLFLPADVVQTAFYNLSADGSAAELREFLDAYFDKPGSEFELWTPLDWHEKWDSVLQRQVDPRSAIS